MARDESHQKTRSISDMHEFPPTVTGHERYKSGLGLSLLDPGTSDNPRYIWIPDDEDEESEFVL